MPTPISEKKLAANRANALKSTGPRTPAGKRKVAQNAFRHGLRSPSLFLPAESPADYAAFIQHLKHQLRPSTPRLLDLFNRLAAAAWKCHHLQQAESRLFATLAQRHPSPNNQPPDPAYLLACCFSENPASNPLLTLHEYELRLTARSTRLLTLYHLEQQGQSTSSTPIIEANSDEQTHHQNPDEQSHRLDSDEQSHRQNPDKRTQHQNPDKQTHPISPPNNAPSSIRVSSIGI